MKTIEPKSLPIPELQRLLQGGIAPRPIALVSTTGVQGDNLSPFSFFNVFSSNPPVVAFSPARRGRDGSLKDTYNNIKETGECVIQAVTYSMVQQVSLASTEYPAGTDEFLKSGLTKVPSVVVKAPGVAESPFRMECKTLEIIHLGTSGGAGNLILCEVLLLHIDEQIFTGNAIDPHKIDLVARLGGDYYCRASGDAIFEVEKPIEKKGIGIDSLPEFIRNTDFLNGNDLGKLGNLEKLPDNEQLQELKTTLLTGTNVSGESFFELEQNRNYSAMLYLLLNNTSLSTKENVYKFIKTALLAGDAAYALSGAFLLKESLS